MAKISNQNIAEAIYQSLEGKKGSGYRRTLRGAVELLARRRLMSQSPQILARLEKLIDEKENILRVKISSARTLAVKSKKHLTGFLRRHYHARKIIFDEFVDEKLLGGAKLEIGDEVIDLTLRQRIKKLEEHLLSQ